jgi:hypothetical protein
MRRREVQVCLPCQHAWRMQRNGSNEDFATLLTPTSADVFFPTHFPSTAQLWKASKLSNRPALARRARNGTGEVTPTAEVMTTPMFMHLYAELKRTKTMSAFNPLLDDFHNTSFLLADCL